MTMSWLMTVQEAGTPKSTEGYWHAEKDEPSEVWIEFDLMPRRISLDSGISDEPPSNANRLATLQHWPRVVEIRRPDGTQVNAELYQGWSHLNFPYELRGERDDAGRIRNPWCLLAMLKGVSVAEVPPGSEVWGEITDEDL
ncbi:MAG: hypothetical protein H0U76_05765 [Ktedonobacteraceae bacterium]|nr:hypothetical protein [Ktedonobacteraceae bacterium]